MVRYEEQGRAFGKLLKQWGTSEILFSRITGVARSTLELWKYGATAPSDKTIAKLKRTLSADMVSQLARVYPQISSAVDVAANVQTEAQDAAGEGNTERVEPPLQKQAKAQQGVKAGKSWADEFLSLEQAAQYLGITKSQMYSWRRQVGIKLYRSVLPVPGGKKRGRCFVRKTDIDAAVRQFIPIE